MFGVFIIYLVCPPDIDLQLQGLTCPNLKQLYYCPMDLITAFYFNSRIMTVEPSKNYMVHGMEREFISGICDCCQQPGRCKILCFHGFSGYCWDPSLTYYQQHLMMLLSHSWQYFITYNPVTLRWSPTSHTLSVTGPLTDHTVKTSQTKMVTYRKTIK